MSTVQEIKMSISKLNADELLTFRSWYEEFDAAMWDKEWDEDARAGRLDKIADSAVADYRKGKAKPL